VTREHKLALIVGFSLVLLVGVLIADHLSLARRAQIAPVGAQELSVTRAPVQLPPEVLLAEAPSPDAGFSTGLSTLAAQGSPPVPPMPVPQLIAEPQEQVAANTPPAVEPMPQTPAEPIQIAQGSARQRTTSTDPDQALAEQVRDLGGEIREGRIYLQPQASVARGEASRSPMPSNSMPSGVKATIQPPPPAAKPIVTLKTYTVQKGDTYVKIAEKLYGDGKLWRELMKFNGGDETVRLGASLRIPSKETLTGKPTPTLPATTTAARTAPASTKAAANAPAPKAAPKKPETTPAKPSRTELALTYTVKKGDTLGDIALRTLGTSKRWREIAEINHLDDEDSIPAGTRLKLPPMRG
jgi:nucleoid-associated protein YgaU